MADIADSVACRGFSGRQLAFGAGLSRSRYVRILGGDASCTISDLEALCAALGLVSWRGVCDVEGGFFLWMWILGESVIKVIVGGGGLLWWCFVIVGGPIIGSFIEARVLIVCSFGL